MTDNAAETGRSLLAWLREQPIKGRWMSGLERDLDVVTGERPTVAGYTGVLAGLTPERFVEELHTDNGGQVGQVYRFGRQALIDLRESLPASAANGAAPAAGEGGREDAAEVPQDTPEPAGAAIEPSDEAPARRRRQRRAAPPEPTAADPAAPSEEASARRRRRRSSVPNPTALEPSPAAAPLAPPRAEPSTSDAPDPRTAQLLRLWRELHPQGRRAVTAYIAALLVEV